MTKFSHLFKAACVAGWARFYRKMCTKTGAIGVKTDAGMF